MAKLTLFDSLVELPRKSVWQRAALDKRDRHMKAKRKHKKRHSENKDRAFADARKAKLLALAKARQSSERAAFLARARAYWAGLTDEHP